MSNSSSISPSLHNETVTIPKKRGRKPKIGVTTSTDNTINTLVINDTHVENTTVIAVKQEKVKKLRVKKNTDASTKESKETKEKKVKESKVKEPKVKPKKTEEEPEQCPCCIENYTSILRKKAVCKYCKADSCSKCIERYLLQGINDAHCMNCRVNYNDETLREICTMTYIQQVYFKHRQQVLLSREKANLPGLQEAALEERDKREREVKVAEMRLEFANMEGILSKKKDRYYDVYNDYYSKLSLKSDVTELKKQLQEINNDIDNYTQQIHNFKIKIYDTRYPPRIDATGNKLEPDKEERKKFIRRCARDNCQGYLSSAWKCGLCEYYTCNKCFVPRSKKQDDTHECKQEDIDTAELIKKDSKPCPNCGEFIMKSSGCFAKDTPILMWGGSTKMSQNICIGDELVGDDGTKRTVLDTTTGVDTMYEVKQNSAMTYVVNSKHTLVLRFNSNSDKNTDIYDKLKRFKTDDSNYHILVDEYILLDDNIKELLVGYKVHPYTTSHIQLSVIGLGEYYGWKVDNNSRFLLSDTTILKNCSQMWCISCKTPWDWNTGKIEHGGMIHNPHYYEWMRRNGNADAIRNPADVPCGGYPNALELRRIPRTVRSNLSNNFYEFHRICQEIQDISQRTYRSHIDNTTTSTINVRFLLNDYDEEHWGQLLAKNERKRKRDREVQEIFGAFRMVAVELLNRIQNYVKPGVVVPGTQRPVTIAEMLPIESEPILEQFGIEVDGLLNMINDALKQVSIGYHYVVPNIIKNGVYYNLIHKNFYEDVKEAKRDALEFKQKNDKPSKKTNKQDNSSHVKEPEVEVQPDQYFPDDSDEEEAQIQAAISASLA